jgi:hypothetical protein
VDEQGGIGGSAIRGCRESWDEILGTWDDAKAQ